MSGKGHDGVIVLLQPYTPPFIPLRVTRLGECATNEDIKEQRWLCLEQCLILYILRPTYLLGQPDFVVA